jgi:hypothetical protein
VEEVEEESDTVRDLLSTHSTYLKNVKKICRIFFTVGTPYVVCLL